VFHNCRVFVAPLLYGAGIKGKVIGALASGTPTVMTSIAAEGIGISNGVEAFIANTIPEWIAHITALYSDDSLWLTMSQRALAFATHHYSFEGGREEMKSALAAAEIYTL
jgi:glycosyltransferase involved in cell wall biosynthesis